MTPYILFIWTFALASGAPAVIDMPSREACERAAKVIQAKEDLERQKAARSKKLGWYVCVERKG